MAYSRKTNRTSNEDVDFPVDPVSPRAKDESMKSEPQIMGEQSESGTMPDPEIIQDKDTLDMAHDVGLYEENDEEHPSEVSIADEINEAEKDRWER